MTIDSEEDSEDPNSDGFDDEFESDDGVEREDEASQGQDVSDSGIYPGQYNTLDLENQQEDFRKDIIEIMQLVQEARPKDRNFQKQQVDSGYSSLEEVLRPQLASSLSTRKMLQIKETTSRFFDQAQGPFFLYPADVRQN